MEPLVVYPLERAADIVGYADYAGVALACVRGPARHSSLLSPTFPQFWVFHVNLPSD